MEWFIPSDSTTVKQAGYDAKRRELHVVYEGGQSFAYSRVPLTVFRHMLQIDGSGHSVAQFVDWVIKPVFRDCREVDDNRN